MKHIILFILLSTLQLTVKANLGDTCKLYHPTANAKTDIEKVIKLAKQSGKHVLVMTGGNWCSWCLRFNKFVTEDVQLDSAIKANYVMYHLNYSKENKNLDLLKKYGYPQRFGFPVFMVLDAAGNRIHTQNSSYLEAGKGYSKEKIMDFLQAWSPIALKPESYKD
jgi:thioredoxin-related protein